MAESFSRTTQYANTEAAQINYFASDCGTVEAELEQTGKQWWVVQWLSVQTDVI
jgi:hypothetical protein